MGIRISITLLGELLLELLDTIEHSWALRTPCQTVLLLIAPPPVAAVVVTMELLLLLLLAAAAAATAADDVEQEDVGRGDDDWLPATVVGLGMIDVVVVVVPAPTN